MTSESDHFRNRAKACAKLAQHGNAAQWAKLLQIAAKWARLADTADKSIALDLRKRTRSFPAGDYAADIAARPAFRPTYALQQHRAE